MKNFYALFLFLIIFLLGGGCGDSIKNKGVPDSLYSPSILSIENFFNELKTKTPDDALNDLLRQNPNIILDDSAVVQLRNSFIEINKFSGKLIDAKMITNRHLSDRVAVFSYLVSYEKRFYRFLFQYYNNGENVRIYKFKFDDSIDLELEESLRLFDKNEEI